MTSTYRPRVQDLVHPEEQQGDQSRQEHVHKHSANKSKNSKLQLHKSTKKQEEARFLRLSTSIANFMLDFFSRRNTLSSARLIFLPTVCTSCTSSTILAASLFVTISHLLLQVCTCSAIFWESCLCEASESRMCQNDVTNTILYISIFLLVFSSGIKKTQNTSFAFSILPLHYKNQKSLRFSIQSLFSFSDGDSLVVNGSLKHAALNLFFTKEKSKDKQGKKKNLGASL